ncbi:transporter substrate-binding domain-containing protein [Gilvimarinus sp. SDUM040013]|uniref:Transporter substrate-binding domain-containing protein n=1 Tax=Gilvimarinus gilvus TaxID=3058038 RepID=A0ABU4RZB6_9GAMM|nr:transporter substrate-binding domain-containing protein [Gilvimarinus sp. SDUM040013]MDO3387269.1 transporter substrate-binding domain-containing protein [Gilvimarinus sp. SDUM040013]MDX6848958.1 transporter substrate-binding domain-containing protein [Gilvimarinus sp. SDUM040013]
MLLKSLFLIVFLSTFTLPVAADERAVVRYPQSTGVDPVYHRQTEYFLAMLALAFVKVGQDYVLEPVSVDVITDSRNARNMGRGLYDVSWLHTNPDRESTLRPVRIPLFKGLTGWRLLLIQPKEVEKFRNITDINQLRALRAGSGNDWPDTRILRANGFQVESSGSRDSLVKMLRAGRVDYMPRSVMEVWDEIELGKADGVLLEPTLALHYPSAFFFFVARSNQELAQIIEQGLELAIADGSFDKLFMQYYGESIKLAELDKRQVIAIKNIPMIYNNSIKRKELWFHPDASH